MSGSLVVNTKDVSAHRKCEGKHRATHVVDINGFDDAVVVEADLVPGVERVAVAGDEHVFVSVEHDSNRAAQLCGSHGGRHADVGSPGLLPSETSLQVGLIRDYKSL